MSRRETELTFLRLVPGETPVHHMWAGAKILVAATLALLVSISPSWAMLGVAAGVVLIGLLVGRIPLGAFPRLPRWFFGALAVGAALNLWSGVHPIVTVGPIDLSIGGLEEWARFTFLALVLIVSGLLIGWTTHLSDVAPAISTLLRPLRWLRLPVDEWVLAIALAIRCLPLLIDEIRTLNAARRLRVHPEGGMTQETERTVRQLIEETHDLLATAIVSSVRRGRDLAEAMIARGGVEGAVSAGAGRVRVTDVIIVVAVAALGVVCLAVLHL
ncbi:MAG TPA: energy-coupling factor transporter transmembrane component T [Acidimicrobiia bacterium]|jgi:energy-coupling factor transport system ATP-binding protein|nr:energy-coupling factor transporter transmembrane component T [Acidimicrobiia bacterium]